MFEIVFVKSVRLGNTLFKLLGRETLCKMFGLGSLFIMLGWEAFSSCWAGKPFYYVGLGSPFIMLGWEALLLCWAGKPFHDVGLGSLFKTLGWEALSTCWAGKPLWGGAFALGMESVWAGASFCRLVGFWAMVTELLHRLNTVFHMINEGQYPCCDVVQTCNKHDGTSLPQVGPLGRHSATFSFSPGSKISLQLLQFMNPWKFLSMSVQVMKIDDAWLAAATSIQAATQLIFKHRVILVPWLSSRSEFQLAE